MVGYVLHQEGFFSQAMEFDSHVMGSKNNIILPNVLGFNLVIRLCQTQIISLNFMLFLPIYIYILIAKTQRKSN